MAEVRQIIDNAFKNMNANRKCTPEDISKFIKEIDQNEDG